MCPRLRHARLAEILRHQNVDRELTPACGDFDILHLEDRAAVGVFNLCRGLGVFHRFQETGLRFSQVSP